MSRFTSAVGALTTVLEVRVNIRTTLTLSNIRTVLQKYVLKYDDLIYVMIIVYSILDDSDGKVQPYYV